MSKNIKLNEKDYNGVSTVQLPTTDGGTATFKDVDEITTPSGTKTITTNGTHDVKNYAQAIVNVPTSGGSGDSSNDMKFLKALLEMENTQIEEDVHFVVPNGIKTIRENAFSKMTNDRGDGKLYIDLPDTIESIHDKAFFYNIKAVIGQLPPNLKEIKGSPFGYAYNLFYPNTIIEIPASVETIGSLAFYQYQYSANTVTFKGTPTSIANNAFQTNKITTINVPWSEGEVADAPWGATSATINYNYMGE